MRCITIVIRFFRMFRKVKAYSGSQPNKVASTFQCSTRTPVLDTPTFYLFAAKIIAHLFATRNSPGAYVKLCICRHACSNNGSAANCLRCRATMRPVSGLTISQYWPSSSQRATPPQRCAARTMPGGTMSVGGWIQV